MSQIVGENDDCCYFILASIQFSGIQHHVYLAGISLLPAVDEVFLLILQQAPPLDLYTVRAQIIKDMLTYYTLNKSVVSFCCLDFPNLTVYTKQQRKSSEMNRRIKKQVRARGVKSNSDTDPDPLSSVNVRWGNGVEGTWSTQVPANQRPIDESTFTQVSLCKHKSY